MDDILPPKDDNGVFMDWLYCKCRDIAKRTDKEFVDAARFGAKALNMRMCADDPTEPHEIYRSEMFNTIWRDPSKERPRDNSTIVLRNAATITYAVYKYGMVYYDGICDRLENFWGKWCYKADLWGLKPDDDGFMYEC